MPLGMNQGLYSAWCSEGFRRVDAEAAEQLGAHQVVLRDAARLDEGSESGIEVLAVMFEAQDPSQVVDSAGEGVDLVERKTQVAGQGMHGPVDRVAEAHDREADALVDRLDEDRKRVDVVEQQGVRADVRHVPGDGQYDRDRPQPAEDAADVDRVVDRVVEPIASRNVEIDLRRAAAAYLDDVDDVVGARQGFPAVQARPNSGRGPQRAGRPAGHSHSRGQPVLVDVVQDDLRVAQLREREEVAQQVTGELDAACSHQNDPRHGQSTSARPSTPTMWRRPWLW